MSRWLGSVWVRGAITLAILAWLLRQVDAGAAASAMLRVDPRALLIVACLVLLDRAVMIWRWLLLLRSSGTAIPTGAAARIFLVSSFVGSFLPAGVGGDAARAHRVHVKNLGGLHHHERAQTLTARQNTVAHGVIQTLFGQIGFGEQARDRFVNADHAFFECFLQRL